ncbi:hypothetical protein SUGI_0513870 [Cryptomeria japonica]|nr:hypothetical protein SUGI_0513870 [Cryptomeria japonica]
MAHQAGKWKCCNVSGSVVAKGMMLLLGMVVGVYMLGPPLYWQVVEGVASASTCPACRCDCPSESMVNIPTDCGKRDPAAREEMENNYTDLLSEELKVQEAAAAESQQKADMALLEAKRFASQYQKEAEKCNAGMETCEEARERAEATLIAEKKLSELWEQRAHKMGWKEEMAQYDNAQTGRALQNRNAADLKTTI